MVRSVTMGVGNVSSSNITKITITFSSAEGESHDIPDLAPGQWESARIGFVAQSATPSVAVLGFTKDGRAGSLPVPIRWPEARNRKAASWLSAAAPVLAGAMIGLLGVLLTSFFNLKKEQLTARLQWKRFLLEHYDSSYREFMAKSAGTLDVNALRSLAEELERSALLPESTRLRIRRGIANVAGSDPASREAVRDAFLQELRSELIEPFN
jgi:uncharacterized membrane-anchored protein YhcB (DUF1043 family)